MDTPEFTTATVLVVEAIQAYKEAHDIPAWMASWVEIATPGQPRWQELSMRGTGLLMGGDPVRRKEIIYALTNAISFAAQSRDFYDPR